MPLRQRQASDSPAIAVAVRCLNPRRSALVIERVGAATSKRALDRTANKSGGGTVRGARGAMVAYMHATAPAADDPGRVSRAPAMGVRYLR